MIGSGHAVSTWLSHILAKAELAATATAPSASFVCDHDIADRRAGH
jgi:hypothetical protein